MLTQIHPKLPMRNKTATRHFYLHILGFVDIGAIDYPDYLIIKKDNIEIHFFGHVTLNPAENYGQVYVRVIHIDAWYKELAAKEVKCNPPENKPWGQREFSVLDPDNNLITFGEDIAHVR